jgi:hypothetical protein
MARSYKFEFVVQHPVVCTPSLHRFCVALQQSRGVDNIIMWRTQNGLSATRDMHRSARNLTGRYNYYVRHRSLLNLCWRDGEHGDGWEMESETKMESKI